MMDKTELRRVIEYSRSLGVDPGQVLRWRMDFAERPRKHVRRPKGTLSMSDAKKKFGLSQQQLAELRQNGMRTTKKAHLILVQETTLKEWMAKYPPPR